MKFSKSFELRQKKISFKDSYLNSLRNPRFLACKKYGRFFSTKKAQATSNAVFLMIRLAVIAGIMLAVVLIVGYVLSAKQDVRQAEASILSKQITDCIAKNGIIESNFDIKNCFFEEEVNKDFYVNATLQSLDSDFARTSENNGNIAMNVYCEPELKQEEGKKYPSCINGKFYVLIKTGKGIERGLLNILIGIEKYGQNVQ